eukprot:7729778-Pyramimonas_sp.AAC.1
MSGNSDIMDDTQGVRTQVLDADQQHAHAQSSPTPGVRAQVLEAAVQHHQAQSPQSGVRAQ